MMDSRPGYDAGFLAMTVALPRPLVERPMIDLQYVHFTVVFDPARKFAAATGVNIDGAALLDLGRADKWHLDPRVPPAQQAGEEVYARNDLDRGHLVRRRDPVWGTADIAQQANEATFVFTNAAPQAARFNQGETLWSGLEDHVLDYSRATRQRISVFTAPVLDPEDPPYRGIRIPRLFWKVAAWSTLGTDATPHLNAAGFVLDQSPQLDDIDIATARALAAGDPPPLGPFRTYQVPIADIARLTGLDLARLAAVDTFAVSAAPRVGDAMHPGWARLATVADIRL